MSRVAVFIPQMLEACLSLPLRTKNETENDPTNLMYPEIAERTAPE